MIQIYEIENSEFEFISNKFDESIKILKTQYDIDLKTYGIYLRIMLNNIQPDSLINLIERIKVNQELENALDNIGGYTTDSLGINNPKSILIELINHLRLYPLKYFQLIEILNNTNKQRIVIADINDIDFLKSNIMNNHIVTLTQTEFQRCALQYCNLILYSFNGKKDFELVYQYQGSTLLIIYKQEHQLYKSQLQRYKHLIEEEVCSEDRVSICDISYKPVPDLPIHISQTIETIVNRIDDLGKKAYENYKEETDTLLEDIEEKIIYKTILSNHKTEYLESNETVFNANGDLVKVYRLKVFDRIRIYPREEFGEKLYQVAVDTDKTVFGKVEENSKFWKSVLAELRRKYTHTLYTNLKINGIKVLPATVESYFSGQRKFPMFNNDLKAIFRLKYPQKNDAEIDLILAPIRKSKSTYNSTMIALGRGIKQEIKLFLKEERIGEILSKLRFTETTLRTFIEDFMPLLEILVKEVYKDETGQFELNFNQNTEL